MMRVSRGVVHPVVNSVYWLHSMSSTGHDRRFVKPNYSIEGSSTPFGVYLSAQREEVLDTGYSGDQFPHTSAPVPKVDMHPE